MRNYEYAIKYKDHNEKECFIIEIGTTAKEALDRFLSKTLNKITIEGITKI